MRTLIVGFFVFCSGLQARSENLSVMGAGAITCGQFAAEFRKNPEFVETASFSWAHGFMSGMNVARMLEHKPYRDLNAQTVDYKKAFIRDYCNDHPLSTYWMATMYLYDSLPSLKSK